MGLRKVALVVAVIVSTLFMSLGCGGEEEESSAVLQACPGGCAPGWICLNSFCQPAGGTDTGMMSTEDTGVMYTSAFEL